MVELVPLADAALDRIPVEHPRYDRKAITPGIVHIGVGNFHRAHQAWYTHRLMQDGQALDWGIIGAGVRPYDQAMREKLLAQDCLTTLVELDPSTTRLEVIGPMIDYLPIEDGNGPLIAGMADAAIRIVSMTVTEGGYYIDPATNSFDAAHPDIQHDAANPQAPKTAFGAIVEAYRLRRAAGVPPFTGLSCDNLQGNGNILRNAVVSLARLSDPDLAEWIDSNASFPNSMVDSIAPAVGQPEIELVRSFGIDDAAPVTHEPFRQWVIEDHFCAGRPNWDAVGAVFTDEVHAFEKMKLRILNGGHQVVSNAGMLLNLATIDSCMTHDLIGQLFRKVALEEIAPHVAAVPGMTPQTYVNLIDQRFRNPKIKDSTRRVAFDGSSRHPGFLLPSIRDALDKGVKMDGLALVEALWARMCEGTREDGSTIEPNDPNWEALKERAVAAKAAPMVWLEMRNIYGQIGDDDAFSGQFETWLKLIWAKGVETAIAAYLQRD